MARVKVEKDNTAAVIDAKDEAVNRALEAVGLQAEGYVILEVPVDTGLLRNSITHALAGEKPAKTEYESNSTHATTPATNKAKTAGKAVSPVAKGAYKGTTPKQKYPAVYVGTNVEYAPYVENGARGKAAQPFLKPGILDHMDEYQRIFEAFLKGTD